MQRALLKLRIVIFLGLMATLAHFYVSVVNCPSHYSSSEVFYRGIEKYFNTSFEVAQSVAERFYQRSEANISSVAAFKMEVFWYSVFMLIMFSLTLFFKRETDRMNSTVALRLGLLLTGYLLLFNLIMPCYFGPSRSHYDAVIGSDDLATIKEYIYHLHRQMNFNHEVVVSFESAVFWYSLIALVTLAFALLVTFTRKSRIVEEHN